MWHESRSFRRTDYTPFPQQDFNQGLHTKTGGNKHNTAITPPPHLLMTRIYRCFQNVLMKRASPTELHTLKKSFITILRSSDNCYFSKQSLPPGWVPGDITLETIIQQEKNYAPSFSSYKTSVQRLLTEISEITLLIFHCHKQADMETDFICKYHVRNREMRPKALWEEKLLSPLTTNFSENMSSWYIVVFQLDLSF